MGIDKQSEIAADIQIGPTDQGMVRIYVAAEGGVELPLDFDPDEAEEIAEELRARVDSTRNGDPTGIECLRSKTACCVRLTEQPTTKSDETESIVLCALVFCDRTPFFPPACFCHCINPRHRFRRCVLPLERKQ